LPKFIHNQGDPTHLAKNLVVDGEKVRFLLDESSGANTTGADAILLVYDVIIKNT
jgi:hypothetical protein